MPWDAPNLKIVLILTVGLSLASVLGFLSQRAKLSPLLGYLAAGYLIGPYSPGFVADIQVSEQLAEIGIVLMLFGVGIHFRWEDLVKFKNIAIPGALGQTFVAATLSALLIYSTGWSWEAGIVVGMAIGVASTVVLVHILASHKLLQTPQAHMAIGWLIVEDVFTVIALLMLPTLHNTLSGIDVSLQAIVLDILMAIVKFALLSTVMFTIGLKAVTYILAKIAQTRSHELFTVTILALTFTIATGSAVLFGSSMALGAFIAGMVVGQTRIHDQVVANTLPLRDAFVVVFFLAVGMLFNPYTLTTHLGLVSALLAIIFIVKPLAAFMIVLIYRYPLRMAMTVAVSLAQIGEFSFILAEQAARLNILPDDGYDIIVACALVSIALNPLLFRWVLNLGAKLKNSKELHHQEPVEEKSALEQG